MSLIGNVLWLVLGGFLVFLLYMIAGLVACCTIIGIPFGIQLWKLGLLALFPFGRTVGTSPNSGCFAAVFNILWLLFGWWEIALVHLFFGFLCAITIIGLPFAKQHLKLLRLSLLPFGTTVA